MTIKDVTASEFAAWLNAHGDGLLITGHTGFDIYSEMTSKRQVAQASYEREPHSYKIDTEFVGRPIRGIYRTAGA